MIRTFLASLFIALVLAAPSYAEKSEDPPTFNGNIKVLVIDQSFKKAPSKDEPLELLEKLKGNLVVGFSDYQGVIEVWRGESGLYLINEIPLEAYVEGVVKAETAEDWEPEALKAQAVIVRTYVLKQVLRNLDRKYHVTSTVLHQVYKGLNSDPRVTEAVRDTKGEVLTYGGEPIMAFYHSTAGGATEVPEEVFGKPLPYLESVIADGRLSPLSVWARRIPLADIAELAGSEKLMDMRVSSRTSTGRAKDIELISNPDGAHIDAAELRKLLGWRRLPSTNFTLEIEGDYAMFEGTGYGHGVGLCQWTSLEMARDGMTYDEILSYFYPSTTIMHDEDLGF